MTTEVQALRRAMKGVGTDESVLIEIISRLDPLQIAQLVDSYSRQLKRDLVKDVKSEVSGKLEKTFVTLLMGPLKQDANAVNAAVKGMGTNENLLNDVLIGRSNADMIAIKQAYQEMFRSSMESAVRGDLSFNTLKLFETIMSAKRAEENTPIDPASIDRDAHTIHEAVTRHPKNHDLDICNILATRSNGQIRAINQAYSTHYKGILEQAISIEFSGHMRDALLGILKRAVDPAMYDAVALEECMKGMGTKDDLLIERVVRIHWDKQRLDMAKRAYQHKYATDLRSRVTGETSGDYKKLLLAVLQ